MDTIDVLRGRFSSAVSTALEDTDTGSKNLLSSIDRKLTSPVLDVFGTVLSK